mgnify:FL=1
MSDIMTFGFQDPLQSFLRMSEFGSGIAKQHAAGLMAQANIAEAEAKLEAARIAAAADAERQARVDELMEKLRKPGAKSSDFLHLAMFLPKDQAKAIQDSVSQMREEEKVAALKESSNIYFALRANRPDLAIKYLHAAAAAERSVANEDGALAAENYIRDIEAGGKERESVEALFGMQTAAIPGGKEAMEAYAKFEEERRLAALFPILQKQKEAEMKKATSEAEKAEIEAKYAERMQIEELKVKAADAGLKDAQRDKYLAEARNLDKEFADLLLEKAAKEARGGLDAKDIMDLEDGLRKEVDAGSKDFRLIDSQYQIIKGSSDTGPGDLARIFAFMKAIDPTSVVREGEQASAATAGGVPSAIWSIYNKALGAGKLSPQLRAEFTREAEKIWKIAKAKNDLIMSRAEVIIRNRKLNRDNVFAPEEQAPAPQGGTAPPRRRVEVDY